VPSCRSLFFRTPRSPPHESAGLCPGRLYRLIQRGRCRKTTCGPSAKFRRPPYLAQVLGLMMTRATPLATAFVSVLHLIVAWLGVMDAALSGLEGTVMPRLMTTRHASQTALCAASTGISPSGLPNSAGSRCSAGPLKQAKAPPMAGGSPDGRSYAIPACSFARQLLRLGWNGFADSRAEGTVPSREDDGNGVSRTIGTTAEATMDAVENR